VAGQAPFILTAFFHLKTLDRTEANAKAEFGSVKNLSRML
jgi:hypothetical protein